MYYYVLLLFVAIVLMMPCRCTQGEGYDAKWTGDETGFKWLFSKYGNRRERRKWNDEMSRKGNDAKCMLQHETQLDDGCFTKRKWSAGRQRYVCHNGYMDTQCTWGSKSNNGKDLGEFQCYKPKVNGAC